MKEAARVAASLQAPEWILALEQTAGHGRRGRAWTMPRGNFAATLVMRPTGTPADFALRSFAAALALFDAFVAVSGRSESFALKWPNDVLLNGGKVAGILLEQSGPHLFIGIGVNLVAAPAAAQVEPGAVSPVDLVTETGALVTPTDFLTPLAAAFARWESQFVTYGFAPLRQAWLNRAARLGQPIRARTATEEFHGTFETVDAQGNLILSMSRGRLALPAADVFF
ncbi:Bifunctional ligase/repressor BirA [Aquimixticola soesokkakensis]|uniref:biotin--[biotin carboxyl-carrier protein] ligase n=2 Tax=Aquimixticola soesokkakensis TaxID=1519096 RepID=A0A1Y5S3M5_9RHOB|nr:Bifunctional ligase/repressor BirA [Aquimixticola soesokkakensis]